MSALSTVRALGQPGRLHAKATHACAGEGRHLFTLYLSTCGQQKDGPGIKDATPFFYSTDGSELLRTLLTINSQRSTIGSQARLDITRRVERQRGAGRNPSSAFSPPPRSGR